MDFFNFHDTLFVVRYHWIWMCLALALGIWVGWYTGAGQKR